MKLNIKLRFRQFCPEKDNRLAPAEQQYLKLGRLNATAHGHFGRTGVLDGLNEKACLIINHHYCQQTASDKTPHPIQAVKLLLPGAMVGGHGCIM